MDDFDVFEYFRKNMLVTGDGYDYMYAEDNEYKYLIDKYENEMKVARKDTFDRWVNSVDHVFIFPDTWVVWESIADFLGIPVNDGKSLTFDLFED